MAAATTYTMEEPILSRLERLDNVLKELESMRGGGNQSPPKSSTASSNTTASTDVQSADFSPKSLEKHCRPIDDVMMETEIKGTLIQRLDNVEDRVAKLCINLQQELEALKIAKEAEVAAAAAMHNSNTNSAAAAAAPFSKEQKKSPKKGLKSLIRSCVKGQAKLKVHD